MNNLENNALAKEFLNFKCKSKSMRNLYKNALRRFLQWKETTPEAIVEEWKTTQDRDQFRKNWGREVTKYYRHLIDQGLKINSALSIITPVRSFFTYYADSLKSVEIDKPQMAFGEHEFDLEQLRRMYQVGDIREKAILATGVCLGYGVTSFVSLKRPFLTGLIEDAKTKGYPIGFWYQRKKEKTPFRSHLTKEAADALTAYWQVAPVSDWAFPNGTGKEHISKDGLNYILKSLAEKAKISIRGQIRWHLLRKFLFSALCNVMKETHAKLAVGKSIPKDILTYLKGYTEELKRQYSLAEKYFVLTGITNAEHGKLEKLEAQINEQSGVLRILAKALMPFIEEELERKALADFIEEE